MSGLIYHTRVMRMMEILYLYVRLLHNRHASTPTIKQTKILSENK